VWYRLENNASFPIAEWGICCSLKPLVSFMMIS
jgi:hypothetical protein